MDTQEFSNNEREVLRMDRYSNDVISIAERKVARLKAEYCDLMRGKDRDAIIEKMHEIAIAGEQLLILKKA